MPREMSLGATGEGAESKSVHEQIHRNETKQNESKVPRNVIGGENNAKYVNLRGILSPKVIRNTRHKNVPNQSENNGREKNNIYQEEKTKEGCVIRIK